MPAGSFPEDTNPKMAANTMHTAIPHMNCNRLFDEPPIVIAYIAAVIVTEDVFILLVKTYSINMGISGNPK